VVANNGFITIITRGLGTRGGFVRRKSIPSGDRVIIDTPTQ
jgi:hypothetical protein